MLLLQRALLGTRKAACTSVHRALPPCSHCRLIDVLKRQRTHLEAARSLAMTEEVFMAALSKGG